jgi:hypothetical protein
MTTISSDGRIAYVYDEDGDTWYPVAGTTNTSSNFGWSGTHTFANSVTLNGATTSNGSVVLTQGVNTFADYATRNSALGATPSANGIFAFVWKDGDGNVVNDLSYSSGGAWVSVSKQAVSSKTQSYQLLLSDFGSVLTVNSSSNLEVTVPANSSVAFPIGTKVEIIRMGSGDVSIIPVSGSGVTIRHKDNYSKISKQYAGAMLVKIAADEWVLIGDLKA